MSEHSIHSRKRTPSTERPQQPLRWRQALRTAGYTVCGLLLSVAATAAEPSECTTGRGNALSEIACELEQAMPFTQPTMVVSATPSADAPLRDASRLAGRIAAVIAQGVGHGAEGHSAAVSLGSAQLAAAKLGALLYLEPEIVDGKLRVVANLYPIARSFWDRVREPHPRATAHAFAERALDPELRSFFATIPLVASTTTQAAPPERSPVALACDDIDDDGSLEVAFVGRRRIALGRIRGGRFVASKERAFGDLAPVAPSPLREPIAGVQFRRGKGLEVGLSDRAHFVLLDEELQIVDKAPTRVPVADSCLELDGHRLGTKFVKCLPDDPAPRKRALDRVDGVVASTTLLSAQGSRVTYVAVYDPRDESVTIESHGKTMARLEHAGGQLAVADLDGDGQPELLTSRATLDPSEDKLEVHTLGPDGALKPRLELAVPDGITALAACPPGTATMAPIIVGTRARLWVIR